MYVKFVIQMYTCVFLQGGRGPDGIQGVPGPRGNKVGQR